MSIEYSSRTISDDHEERKCRWWENILNNISHKGPRNLLLRSGTEVAQASLSFILLATDSDSSGHICESGICQLLASLTFLIQFKTSHPLMFIGRALLYFTEAAFLFRAGWCGFASIGDACASGWHDDRRYVSAISCLDGARMALMASSLLAQYVFPRQGLGQHGNDQLLYRGSLHCFGIAIQYTMAMVKGGSWHGTIYQPKELEVVVHLVRAFFIIPVSTWSVWDQWVSCGIGKRTDDRRTAGVGSAHPNHVNNLMHKLSPHKGHRNLLIRGVCTLGQASVTVWLVIYAVGRARNVAHLFGQLVSATSLLIQWRTGNPYMFLLRGCCNWYSLILAVYGAACGGGVWPGEPCKMAAWEDDRIALKMISSLLCFRVFCNGLSLFCQFKYPHRMFRKHGNEQLFCRGTIQACGIPLHVATFFVKGYAFKDNLDIVPYSRVDMIANLLKGFVFIPISASSLYHQWYNTSAGNTGHPASDLYEREMNPEIVDPQERLIVTMISASGLRRADILTSDPYCTCTVMGRPESSVSTQWIASTLAPVWNESFELPIYRFHDSLKFVVKDHDEPRTGCCKFFDDGDDHLGELIMCSAQIHHPNGFEGDLQLKHAGLYHKNASIKVKIEILGTVPADEDGNPLAKRGVSLFDEVKETLGGVIGDVKEVLDECDVALRGLGDGAAKVVCEGANSRSDLISTIGCIDKNKSLMRIGTKLSL